MPPEAAQCTVVCLGLGVAVSAHLLLSSVRQLLLVQAEDVMHELVLFTGLDHPTSEKHTGSTKKLDVIRNRTSSILQC